MKDLLITIILGRRNKRYKGAEVEACECLQNFQGGQCAEWHEEEGEQQMESDDVGAKIM